MVAVPMIVVFGAMIWFAFGPDGHMRSEDEKAQEKYDQRSSSNVPVYDIQGFDYCVYRISTPDGDEYESYAGQDKMYFIAKKTDNPEDAMSNILETSAGPATYDDLPKARSALDSLYEGMKDQTSGSGPVYTGGRDDGSTLVESSAEVPDDLIVAEGVEESAVIEGVDPDEYEFSDYQSSTFEIATGPNVVVEQTDLRNGY